MYFFLPFLALASIQSTYGPALPPEPVTAKPADLVLTDVERMLRVQGVSETGIRALRSVPMPQIARGATTAAQCAVEKLAEAEPIPLADLASAMEERDATAAAQAQAQTRYIIAALRVLDANDRRIFLKVVGSGELPIGGMPPPRPEAGRRGSASAERGPPGGGGPGGQGRRGEGGGAQRGNMPGGGPGGPGGPDARGSPPAGFAERGPAPTSGCERYLGG